jgi:acyl-CoA thioesterase FadM
MSDFDKKLRSGSDFDDEITIKHIDGSSFNLKYATLREDQEKVYVYTEHCGFFFFYKEDLKSFKIVGK